MLNKRIFSFVSINIVLILIMFAEIKAKMKTLDDYIPYHFKKTGEPDRFIAKNNLYILPVISIILVLATIILAAMNYIPKVLIPYEINDENREYLSLTTTLHLIIYVLIVNANLRSINGKLLNSKQFSIKPILIIIGCSFLMLLLYLSSVFKYGKTEEEKRSRENQRRQQRQANGDMDVKVTSNQKQRRFNAKKNK